MTSVVLRIGVELFAMGLCPRASVTKALAVRAEIERRGGCGPPHSRKALINHCGLGVQKEGRRVEF